MKKRLLYLFIDYPSVKFDEVLKSTIGLVEKVVGGFLCNKGVEIPNICTLVCLVFNTVVKITEASCRVLAFIGWEEREHCP